MKNDAIPIEPSTAATGTIARRAVFHRSRFTRRTVDSRPTSFGRRLPANRTGRRYATAEPTPTRIATNAAEKNGFRFTSSGAAYAIVESNGVVTSKSVGSDVDRGASPVVVRSNARVAPTSTQSVHVPWSPSILRSPILRPTVWASSVPTRRTAGRISWP